MYIPSIEQRKRTEGMDYVIILWSLLSLACILLLRTIHGKRSESTRIPPGPVPLPVVGSLFKLGTKPHISLAKLANTYGPLMTLQLGSLTTVVVSSPEMAKEILQKNDHSVSHRTVVDAIRAHNHHKVSVVFTPPYAHWRNLRRICHAQMFCTQKLDAYQDLRRQKVQDLLKYVGESCRAGLAVDIGNAAFTTILNSIWNTLSSFDLADPSSKSSQEFKDLVWGMMKEAGKPNLADYFPILRMIDPQGIRGRMETHFAELMALFDSVLQQRLQYRATHRSPTNNDVIDAFLDLHEENGAEFDLDVIKHLMTDLFVAGTDTTSSTVEWAMTELVRNPDIMAKARAELHKTVGKDKAIEESDIPHLPYLQAVMKETFRLHPVVPLLVPHKANANVKINGVTLPKDAQVLVNVWAIGRDPSIWKDPNSFLPERFMESEIDVRGRHFELIPFGAGRRICPGMPLALKMMQVMLASLIHSFEWRLEDGMTLQGVDVEEEFGLTLRKAKPLRIMAVEVNKHMCVGS